MKERPGESFQPKENHLALCILASGSKGNATYLSDSHTAILIDAGLSGKEIERRLQSRDLSAEGLDAIVVSHEHSDHIHGVGVLARRYNLPVYINKETRGASPRLGKIKDLRTFECGKAFHINQMCIHPFSISHDAKDPSGFTIGQNGIKIGLATDLGVATALVKKHLADCRLLILEANHDPKMLEEGPYPWPLKQRVKGRTGHLSNEASRELLQELRHDRLEHVILAHLSEVNNTPDRALHVVGEALTDTKTGLSVASQYDSGDLYFLKS
jgi:phosphoribosyl 1,2-cyclic phosphodiesterase